MGIAAGCLLAAKLLLHYFQLESYQFPGYFRTLRRNLLKSMLPGICLSALLLLISAVFYSVRTQAVSSLIRCVLIVLLMATGGFLLGRIFTEKKAKKAFVYTPRIRRLYGISFAVMTLLLLPAVNLMGCADGSVQTVQPGAAAFVILFPAFLPFWVALCGLIAWPVEKGISELYFRDAQRILRSRNDLIRIGITGSWGKTSVKFILGTILEEQYRTLVTPASYNTPMGVTKVIRSSLNASHRVFVAEMGARHVGDIREMCRLVHPQIGILTSVGPQHLDTFRTLERIIKTKYELIDALPDDGLSFFADDGGICRDLYNRTEKAKILAGLDAETDDVWAEQIQYSPEGSSFDLCTSDRRVHCTTQLLGELNIRNILLCAAVAFRLGMKADQIARGISRIQPIEHRLQLIRNPGGLSVIDDAFNSNIRGARQAFQVLKDFPGKRIVVTPGMVELGTQETAMNREFGTIMAGCCDVAMLIGKKRSAAIREGLLSEGFSESGIIVLNSLSEATEQLKVIAGPGDTVLFENDLPDNYSE